MDSEMKDPTTGKRVFTPEQRAIRATHSKVWYENHRDLVREQGRSIAKLGARRANYLEHRIEILAQRATYYANNRDEIRARRALRPRPDMRSPEDALRRMRRRREAKANVPPYARMDPWPTDCQCCHEEIDSTLRHTQRTRERKALSIGHEPPIAWARDHPEYRGPYILRPEHFWCNLHKTNRPDWEMPK
jgi:hypothetical protein